MIVFTYEYIICYLFAVPVFYAVISSMALTQIIVNTKYFNNNFSTLLSHRKRTFEKFSKRSAQLSVVELRRNIV